MLLLRMNKIERQFNAIGTSQAHTSAHFHHKIQIEKKVNEIDDSEYQ